jgi:hypothetical protein
MGKDCSTCWRAGVLACTRTGEDALFQHSNIPLFPSKVTPQFVRVRQLPDRAGGLSVTSQVRNHKIHKKHKKNLLCVSASLRDKVTLQFIAALSLTLIALASKP